MEMLPPFMYLVLTLGAFAIAGGLLMGVVGYLKGKGKENPSRHTQPSATEAAAEQRQVGSAEEQELLRVSRIKRGELAIFVQGQRYYHLRGVKDPRVGREAVEAIQAVLSFAEGWLPALQKAAPQSPSSSPSKESIVDEETFLKQLSQSDLFPQEEKPPGMLQKLVQRASPSAPAPLPTPAEAIDKLVQERLQNRPELAGQYIRLATEPSGGLRIYVGHQTFEAVSDISNTQVRTLIQDAIREWEGS
jgi:hypothetical protein